MDKSHKFLAFFHKGKMPARIQIAEFSVRPGAHFAKLAVGMALVWSAPIILRTFLLGVSDSGIFTLIVIVECIYFPFCCSSLFSRHFINEQNR